MNQHIEDLIRDAQTVISGAETAKQRKMESAEHARQYKRLLFTVGALTDFHKEHPKESYPPEWDAVQSRLAELFDQYEAMRQLLTRPEGWQGHN